METTFELPDELDLPAADQSQPADSDVCDVLADDAGSDEPEASESADLADQVDPVEVTESDVVADAAQPETVAADPPVTVDPPAAASPIQEPPRFLNPGWAVSAYYDDQADLLERIREAAAECRRAACRIEAIKADMKEAKGSHEKALLDLQQLCSELIEPQKPSWGSGFKPSTLSTPAAVTIQPLAAEAPINQYLNEIPSEVEAAAESTSDAVQDDLSWRSVPLTEIGIDSIKGLGTKKLEALLDLCPTLGAFEDLRAKVGRDASSLPELMPRGIGQQACDALEEKVLDWIAKSRKPVAVPEAAQQNPTTAAEVEAELGSQIARRAAELDNGKPNCLANMQTDDTLWKGGFRSFEDSVAITECPWMPGENQDEWLRGWLAARAVDAHERAKQEMAEDGALPASDPTKDETPFDIDSL